MSKMLNCVSKTSSFTDFLVVTCLWIIQCAWTAVFSYRILIRSRGPCDPIVIFLHQLLSQSYFYAIHSTIFNAYNHVRIQNVTFLPYYPASYFCGGVNWLLEATIVYYSWETLYGVLQHYLGFSTCHKLYNTELKMNQKHSMSHKLCTRSYYVYCCVWPFCPGISLHHLKF